MTQKKTALFRPFHNSKNYYGCTSNVKGKAIPVTELDRPLGFHKIEAPRFQDNGHMKVIRLSSLRTGRLYPSPLQEIFLVYSFLLEAESTPGPKCGWKDYVDEKFQ